MINQDSKPTKEKGSTAVTVKPLCSNMEKPNMNMPILTQFGNPEQKTMSSRVIADLTEKRHDHVKRDVENMLGQLGLDIPKFGGIYFDAQNRQQTEYLLDEELTMTLVTGYNIVLRNRVIKRCRHCSCFTTAADFSFGGDSVVAFLNSNLFLLFFFNPFFSAFDWIVDCVGW